MTASWRRAATASCGCTTDGSRRSRAVHEDWGVSTWALALRLARREMRGGIRGFRIFLACLMLGVAAIGAVGSLAAGVSAGLDADARQLLGGDVDLTLTERAAKPDEFAALAARGTVSAVM